MNLVKMRGAGGLDVHLVGGTTVEGSGADQTVAYADLDDLYKQLGLAIALRRGAMSPEEARFLRKRLKMTQADLGRLGGKTEQVAAKWEKGTLPVPQAEATLLRLKWLAKFARSHVRTALEASGLQTPTTGVPCFVFKFDGQSWRPHRGTRAEETHASADEGATITIANAMASASAVTYAVRA